MNNINMEQVAKLAGVSKITVSRAIRSPNLVKESTRLKIEKIIEEQNYVYNISAADFSRDSSTLVGLIIPSVKSSIYADYIDGIDSVIRKTHYSLLIGYTNFNIEEEAEVVRTFLQRKVCGLITIGIQKNNRELYEMAKNSNITVVTTWEYSPDKDFNCVGFDNYKAGYDITKYLISLGHKKIGMIMGPYSQVYRVQQRYNGYIAALQEADITPPPEYAIEKHPTFIEGKEAMERLLQLNDPPTAVFAASDTLAIGAITSIRENGLKVPDDISIAGFDNLDIAYFYEPSLTTIRVPAYEMGRIATNIIIDSVEKKQPPRRYCLDTDLIVRNSCKSIHT